MGADNLEPRGFSLPPFHNAHSFLRATVDCFELVISASHATLNLLNSSSLVINLSDET
jgi:hypothetical protein